MIKIIYNYRYNIYIIIVFILCSGLIAREGAAGVTVEYTDNPRTFELGQDEIKNVIDLSRKFGIFEAKKITISDSRSLVLIVQGDKERGLNGHFKEITLSIGVKNISRSRITKPGIQDITIGRFYSNKNNIEYRHGCAVAGNDDKFDIYTLGMLDCAEINNIYLSAIKNEIIISEGINFSFDKFDWSTIMYISKKDNIYLFYIDKGYKYGGDVLEIEKDGSIVRLISILNWES